MRLSPIAFLLAALTLLLAACGGGSEVSVEPVATSTEAPAGTRAATVAAAAASPTTPRSSANATATPVATATPEPYDGDLVAMRIPALEVDAAVERTDLIKVNERPQLDVPDDPHNVAWYPRYGTPGIDGDTIYSAHKDYFPDIRGPFWALAELEDGDEIVLVMEDGREYVYEVFFQRRYRTEDVPMRDLIKADRAENPELLRPADEEWITLITCGGEFVATSERGSGIYLHRDIVIARRVDRPSSLAAAGP